MRVRAAATRPAVVHLGEVGRVLLFKVSKLALETLRRLLTREAVGDGDLDRLDGRVQERTVARRLGALLLADDL